jgi:hypothetical protein
MTIAFIDYFFFQQIVCASGREGKITFPNIIWLFLSDGHLFLHWVRVEYSSGFSFAPLLGFHLWLPWLLQIRVYLFYFWILLFFITWVSGTILYTFENKIIFWSRIKWCLWVHFLSKGVACKDNIYYYILVYTVTQLKPFIVVFYGLHLLFDNLSCRLWWVTFSFIYQT